VGPKQRSAVRDKHSPSWTTHVHLHDAGPPHRDIKDMPLPGEVSVCLRQTSPFAMGSMGAGLPSGSSAVALRLFRDPEAQSSVLAALHHPFVRALGLGSLSRCGVGRRRQDGRAPCSVPRLPSPPWRCCSVALGSQRQRGPGSVRCRAVNTARLTAALPARAVAKPLRSAADCCALHVQRGVPMLHWPGCFLSQELW
jgi:hypothetical protein